MSEKHPADELLEALLDYDNTNSPISRYYVVGYLNSILRQIVDSLPEGLEKRAAYIMLRQKTENLKDKTQFLKDQSR